MPVTRVIRRPTPLPHNRAMYDFAVIGGGIVGLATAREILLRNPGASLVLLEKELSWAAHQSGRNSGVIHSGIYYKPGSLKARLARAGNRSMVHYCRERGIPHDICGKLIVATTEDEARRLDALLARGQENGIDVRRLTADEARQIEPHVSCLAALHVPSAGIVDFGRVADGFAADIVAANGDLRTGTRVDRIDQISGGRRLMTSKGVFDCRSLISCAGLYSDRIARADRSDPGARVVPFRGEYYELRPEARHLVKGLIYPVPDTRFPFLGVHLTRSIDGGVHAGPNAVLAFAREGYTRWRIDVHDLADTLLYRGFWILASNFWREGAAEMLRSISRRRFTESLQQLVPAITIADLVPAEAGVRAQSITPDGSIVDDFLIVRSEGSLHVCNAPSPAATASLEIAKEVADRLQGVA
jgi:L-2-hydroxyglutarate oxidase